MADKHDIELEISAWLDGELDGERAREIEALIAGDEDLAAEARAMEATGGLLRAEVDAAEARVDMTGFSDRVMASIGSADSEASSGAIERDASSRSFFGRLKEGLAEFASAHRPVLAAVATMLVVLGGSSFYFLLSHQGDVDPASPVVVRGGPTVIEDLSFGDASAVVYRTESDVTVIWVTED